jgi:hypothetical protein
MGLVARLDGSRLVWTAMLATNFCSAVLRKNPKELYKRKRCERKHGEDVGGCVFYDFGENRSKKALVSKFFGGFQLDFSLCKPLNLYEFLYCCIVFQFHERLKPLTKVEDEASPLISNYILVVLFVQFRLLI